MVSLKNKKGFTIVELLIVIVVIGILATLVIVTFTVCAGSGILAVWTMRSVSPSTAYVVITVALSSCPTSNPA